MEEGSGTTGGLTGTPGTQPSGPPNTFVKEFVTIILKLIIWLKIIKLKITNKISLTTEKLESFIIMLIRPPGVVTSEIGAQPFRVSLPFCLVTLIYAVIFKSYFKFQRKFCLSSANDWV